MLDKLGNSDVTGRMSEINTPEWHAHALTLTRLSWLQPEAGAEALLALLATPQGIKSLKSFIARACPRLSPALNVIITQELRGVFEQKERMREVMIQEGDATTLARASRKAATLVELLGEEVRPAKRS